MKGQLTSLLLLFSLTGMAGAGQAQQACEAPAYAKSATAPNIFSAEMESALGDLVAARIEARIRTTDDPAVTAYLTEVGARLERELPPNHIKFRFYLADMPYPQAFEIPGGRIYVSQKMIAIVKNEDELAGVLSHEMGHLVTHQSAITITAALKNVLGVREIKSPDEVAKDLALLLANWRRDPESLRHSRGSDEELQAAADQVGLYTLARAGYSPQSFVDVFNRLAETKSQTGDWFTDLFHQTTPDMKRLRQQIQTLRSLPADCITRHSADLGGFQQWQRKALAFSDWKKQESLPGLERTVKLSSPLQSNLEQIRFSPDGKYILAQDSAAIYILKRDPLGLLFEIPSEKAWRAYFTPDSQAVVFPNSSLEVENWNLASQKRASLNNIVVPMGCVDAVLSQAGKTLACLQSNGGLKLIDVASGQIIYDKAKFDPIRLTFGRFTLPNRTEMEFSPDGRFFLATVRGGEAGFDTEERREARLRGSISSDLPGGFAFLGSDRIAVRERDHPDKVMVASFPRGKKMAECEIGLRSFTAPTQGDDLIVPYPDSSHMAGVMDIHTGKYLAKDRAAVPDVYGNTLVTEDMEGNLALVDLPTRKILTRVPLRRTDVGFVSAAAVSPDLKWLALSKFDRGGAWNLETGERQYLVRGFDAAWFDSSYTLYADFPKFENSPHVIGLLSLEGQATVDSSIGEVSKYATQHGPYFSVVKPAPSNAPVPRTDRNITREIRDLRTDKLLWSRHFPKETPGLGIEPVSGTGVLFWRASADEAKEEAEKIRAAAKALRDDRDKNDDFFAEAFDIASGNSLGAAVVDTGRGSFRPSDVFAIRTRLFVQTTTGEVLVYSLMTGEKLGQVLGVLPEVSGAASLMAVRSNASAVDIYDLRTFARIESLRFSNPVILLRFSADGKKLMVLTSKQTAYLLDVSRTPAAPQQAAR